MNEYWNAFNREKTDQQYNPTLWTRRLPTDDLLSSHIEFTNNRSAAYRSEMKERLQTINYGEGEFAGSMDVFLPANSQGRAPVLIYIHGGWWQWFSKEQFSFLAEPFNKQGFKVYMPGYRMAQDWESDIPMESIVEQMGYATAAILKQAEEDRAPAVYLAGHSAGGQLVAMLHQLDWSRFGLSQTAHQKLKGVFSIAGLFDIRPLVDSFVNDVINMSMDSAAKVSPQLMELDKDNQLCPLHLILPEFDTPEFFRQTKEYQDKFLKADQVCHFKLINNRDHLNIIERMLDDSDDVFNYMVEHMHC